MNWKSIWRESASLHTQTLMQNPTLLPRWFTRHGWTESWELVSGHESTFPPYCQLFWLKHLSLSTDTYLLNYWLWGSVQCAAKPELSNSRPGLVVCCLHAPRNTEMIKQHGGRSRDEDQRGQRLQVTKDKQKGRIPRTGALWAQEGP